MNEMIVDHAIRNVWCSPTQDLQARIALQRISPKLGVWNYIETMRRTVKLPTNNDRYHVYTVGQLYPVILGLEAIEQQWVKFSDVCKNQNLIVDLYNQHGIRAALTESYYMVTQDRSLLIAVMEQDRNPINLKEETLYLRVYTNQFYRSDRVDLSTQYVDVVGARTTNTDMILELQNQFNDWASLPGVTFAYVNGQLVDSVNLFSVALGDYVEMIHDGSVFKVMEFPVNELQAFTSTLDAKVKYLLRGVEGAVESIEYQDDIDVFVVKKNGNRFKGVFFHRNYPDAMRNVTHRDFAICAPYLQAFLANNEDWTPDNTVVRLYVRQSGYFRPLVLETNRIHELYKMQHEDITRAMLGVESNVTAWRAETLEASGYTEIMRVDSSLIDREMVQRGYGYNAITQLLANTPAFTRDESSQLIVDVPFGLQQSSMAYEYDVDGLLLGYYQHYSGSYYSARNAGTKLVEMIAGVGGVSLDENYGITDAVLDPAVDYRFYVCPILSGFPTNEWADVTGTEKVSVANNQVHFNIDPTREYTLIRGNRAVLAYDIDLPSDEGLLKFSLVSKQNRGGTVSDYVMQIPLGEYDFWINGHSAVKGVDYVMHFPEVVILSKRYLDDPLNKPQKITVRATGFCKSDLTTETISDTGFIRNGLLSSNNRFDIRDDKVLRITVGGALYHRSELRYAELDSGVTVPDAKNGMPYMVRDIVVPLRGQAQDDTYEVRAASRVIDQQISDYLTLRIPQPEQGAPNGIPDLYPVFSPFLAKMMFDLKKGDLDDSRLMGHYSDSDILDICKPYEYLLAYDPTQTENELPSEFVRVEPHHLNETVELSIYHYRFLTRVIKLYLKDKTTLVGYTSLSE